MRRRGTPAGRARHARRRAAGRRVVTVFGVCAAAVAFPAGLAASAEASSSAVVSVTACDQGLGIGVAGISLTVGESCQTAAPTGGGGSFPEPSIGPPRQPLPTEPEPSPVGICTLPPPPTPAAPEPKVVTPAPPPPRVVAAPVIAPPPPPPPPKPKPTPKPTPKPKPPPRVTPTPFIVQPPPVYHAVPFRKISPVLLVFVVAIVPVSLARIRHRSR